MEGSETPEDEYPPSFFRKFSTISDTASTSPSSSSSSASILSSSSSLTVRSPGALKGKAVHALGRVTLRMVEKAAMRNRLAAITAQFPYKDSNNLNEIEQMYDDLLELARYVLLQVDRLVILMR